MGKPTIYMVTDYPDWAWDIKAKYVRKHLRDEFDIRIYCAHDKEPVPTKGDLYFTFNPVHLEKLKGIGKNRRITGATGHGALAAWFNGEEYFEKVLALHANSKLLFDSLKGCHDKIYYLPNGVDCNLFKPQKFEKHVNLIAGFVGKRMVVKGVEDYIKPAVRRVPYVELKMLRCTWRTSKPLSEMPNFYRGIDVYCVASTADGTPNPALEAAACGRTIIANRIGNMPEFIDPGENGFLVNLEYTQYVKRLKFLRDHRKKMQRMGELARQTALKWDWSIQAENYRQMFRDLL